MYRTTALRALFAFALALPLACSDGNGPPPEDEDVNASKGDDDSAEDDTSEEDDTSDDDAPPATKDASVGGKIDGGTKPIDSGTKTETPKADAGSKADAGDTAKPDATIKPDTGEKPKPKCMKKDSQLIVIGDSYINWSSHSFPADIQKESGGQKWRMEAIGGYSMASGGLGLIPPQFDQSIARDGDAHTVLMSGGGNDILLADLTLDPFGECQMDGSSKVANCQKIVQMAIDAASSLMDRMAAKGIRDVVYFFYPHVPGNTIISGPKPNEILDYALPLVKTFCESAEERTSGKLRCTFIDMVPVFEGQTGMFNSDIHPNNKGSAAMAKKVWEVMTDKCIGQKDPKDCCES